jgi:hypothetical protein
MLQLPQGFSFNLPDTLAGDRELLPDLLKRVVGVHPNPEAHSENALLARGQ